MMLQETSLEVAIILDWSAPTSSKQTQRRNFAGAHTYTRRTAFSLISLVRGTREGNSCEILDRLVNADEIHSVLYQRWSALRAAMYKIVVSS